MAFGVEAEEAERFRLGHRPALDGIRGLGMLLVVVFHTLTYLVDWYGPYGRGFRNDGTAHSILPGAFVAVDVFFALSGFLITSLLLEERRRTGGMSMRRFYIRRALRLLPALYATLAIFGVVALVSDEVDLHGYWVAAVKMLTYSANFFIGTDNLIGGFERDGFLTAWFGQTWSLAIEEQFYIVWPLVLALLVGWLRHRPRALAGVVAGAVVAIAVWRIVLFQISDIWSDVYYRTDARLDQPLVGALLAVLLHFGIVVDKPRPWWGIAGLGIWMAATLFSSPFEAAYFRIWAPVVMVGSCLTMLGVLHGKGIAAAALGWRPLRWLGRISYTLYLVHVFIFELVRRNLDGDGRNVLRVVVANGAALAMTVLVHRLVEAPALRLKDRWAPTPSPRSTAPVEDEAPDARPPRRVPLRAAPREDR
jgi:peptidoglycan/LPS O-acetylase OafA/YrhL